MTLTPDQTFAQTVAETYWQAATSDNHAIARYDSAVYKALQRALISAIRIAYGLPDLKANRVRDILSELGPFDGANGYPGHGIYSYVQYAKDSRNYRR